MGGLWGRGAVGRKRRKRRKLPPVVNSHLLTLAFTSTFTSTYINVAAPASSFHFNFNLYEQSFMKCMSCCLSLCSAPVSQPNRPHQHIRVRSFAHWRTAFIKFHFISALYSCLFYSTLKSSNKCWLSALQKLSNKPEQKPEPNRAQRCKTQIEFNAYDMRELCFIWLFIIMVKTVMRFWFLSAQTKLIGSKVNWPLKDSAVYIAVCALVQRIDGIVWLDAWQKSSSCCIN